MILMPNKVLLSLFWKFYLVPKIEVFMNWKSLLKSALHAIGGGVAAAGLAWIAANIPAITAGLDPSVAAIVGSMLSSIISAFSKPPNK